MLRSVFVVGADEEIVGVASSHDRRQCEGCADPVPSMLGHDIGRRDFSLVSKARVWRSRATSTASLR
jgi:hypothetical protein